MRSGLSFFAIGAVIAFAAPSSASAEVSAASFAQCLVAKDRDAAQRLVVQVGGSNAPTTDWAASRSGCNAPASTSAVVISGAVIEAFYKRDFVEFGLRPRRPSFEFLPLDMPRTDVSGDKNSLAMCVARSAPDVADRLFRSRPGSEVEGRVVKQLIPYFSACEKGGAQVAMAKNELRGLIARGAYAVSARYWSDEMRTVGSQ